MLKRLTIVAIVSITAAYFIGNQFDNRYKKRWATLFFEKIDESIDGKNNYDIILLGNSRVHFGLNPYYLDSITKLNCYNFGFGGADAEQIMMTTYIYLQHHKAPKLAIISLDMGSLKKFRTLKTSFEYLFYLENDTINKYMQQAGFLTPLIKVFPFTKYSFFDEYNRTSLFIKGNQYPVFDYNIYKGFINIHQSVHSKVPGLYNIPAITTKIWDTALFYLRNTVATLQKSGSTVVFISPPEKISSKNQRNYLNKTTDSIFANIAKEYSLSYLHFENNTAFTDDYFVDNIHLNEPGTKIYSIQLSDSINKIYPYLIRQAQY